MRVLLEVTSLSICSSVLAFTFTCSLSSLSNKILQSFFTGVEKTNSENRSLMRICVLSGGFDMNDSDCNDNSNACFHFYFLRRHRLVDPCNWDTPSAPADTRFTETQVVSILRVNKQLVLKINRWMIRQILKFRLLIYHRCLPIIAFPYSFNKSRRMASSIFTSCKACLMS